MFWKRRSKTRDTTQQDKLEESRRMLLVAASQTTQAAQAVTTILKARLDDSLRQFEYTARVMNDALFVCDLDGTIRASNPAARHMFGVASLIGTPIVDLFDISGQRPTDAQTLWDMIQHTSRWTDKDPAPLRGFKPFADLVFWIEPGCAVLNWSDGTASMVVIVRNVDPVVTLRDSAKDAKARFQAAFDLTFDGMLIVQNGRVAACNATVCEIFGRSTGDLMGRELADLFVPEDRTMIDAGLDRVAFTFHGVHASGALRDVLYSASSVVWLSQSATLVVLKDMTRATDHSINAPAMLDNGIDMVCVFAPDFRITSANATFADAHGLDHAMMIGRDVRDFLGSQPRDGFEDSLRGLTPSTPAVRTLSRTGPTATDRDWVDHALYDARGDAVAFQRIGRDAITAL